MARKLINLDDITHAARELVARGEQPSTLKIYEILGRGSYGTITKYLKQWEDSGEAAAARIDALPAKADVPEMLLNDAQALAKKSWTAAKAMADEQLDIERKALEEVKAKYQAEIEQAITLADKASAKQEEAEELLTVTRSTLSERETKITELTTQFANQERVLLDAQALIKALRDDILSLASAKQTLSEEATAAKATLLAEQRHLATVEQQFSEQRSDHAKMMEATEQRHQAEIARLTQLNDKHLAELRGQLEGKVADLDKRLLNAVSTGEAAAQKIQQQAGTLGEYKTKVEAAEKALLEAGKKIALLEQNQAGKSG